MSDLRRVASTYLLTVWLGCAKGSAHINDRNGIRRVLLVSIAGMHVLVFMNCSRGASAVNDGEWYCPHLTGLAQHVVNYTDTTTSKPSDSFPGLMALVSGGSPRSEGAFL